MSGADDGIRVSDAERDATLRALGDHAAAGRLTLDELEERSGRALAARTRGDLAALVTDLPAAAGAGAAGAAAPAGGRPRRPVRWMVAVMGGTHRRGRFRAVGSINAVAIMGGDQIDLRDAEIVCGPGGELRVNVFALMGGPEIFVPDSVDVELGGFSVMGGAQECGAARSPRPGAPVIRVRTFALMGGATVYRLPPQARGLPVREARRLARAAERGTLAGGLPGGTAARGAVTSRTRRARRAAAPGGGW